MTSRQRDTVIQERERIRRVGRHARAIKTLTHTQHNVDVSITQARMARLTADLSFIQSWLLLVTYQGEGEGGLEVFSIPMRKFKVNFK